MKGKSLDELLQVSQAQPAKADGEDLGECASRPEPGGCPSLYVLNGKEDTRAFQYVHLGFANFAADGTSFRVEFNEPEKWRLEVKGRRLWRVFVNLHQHKLEWIKKPDRDFDGGGTPAITSIAIEAVAEGAQEFD